MNKKVFGRKNMIILDGRDKYTLNLIKYIAYDDKLKKILKNSKVIRTPIINGKQSTIGYMRMCGRDGVNVI